VNADQLEGSLDRFGQFFEAPLFSESATARELNAIDSEHAKNIHSDGFRLHQVWNTSRCIIVEKAMCA
jgi:insulysin